MGRKLSPWRCYLLVAAAALLVPVATCHAEIIVNESTQYYSISGRTGVELGRSMIKGASGLTNKRDAIAATAAEYHVGEADITVRNGRCVVLDVDLVLTLTYHLPRWKNQGNANPQLRAVWQKFYEELVRHEKYHGEIAKQGAKELEAALKRLSGTVAFNCNDFGAFAATRLNFLANRLQMRHDAFDRRENFPGSRISRLQITLIGTR